MYEYNFPAPPFQVLFYILSASIINGNDGRINPVEVKSWMKKAANYLILIFFFTLIAPQYVGLYYFDKAKKVVADQDLDSAYRYLLYASTCGYASSMVQESMADFLNQIYSSSAKFRNDQLKYDIENYYLKALRLNSLNGEIYISIAAFYYKTGRPGLSEKYLTRATNLFPFNQFYKTEMARFYRATGRISEAVKILTDVDNFLRKYSPFFPLRVAVCFELAEYHRIEGNMNLYQNYKEKAERLKRLFTVK